MEVGIGIGRLAGLKLDRHDQAIAAAVVGAVVVVAAAAGAVVAVVGSSIALTLAKHAVRWYKP